jgi:hypothetical protein
MRSGALEFNGEVKDIDGKIRWSLSSEKMMMRFSSR